MTPSEPDSWNACPPGELRAVAVRLRRRRRRRVWGKGLAGTSLAVLLVVGAWWSLRPAGLILPGTEGHLFAGLTCRQVQGMLPALAAKRLEPQSAAQVREHLRQCAHCRTVWQRMYSDVSRGAARPDVIVAAAPAAVSGAVGR